MHIQLKFDMEDAEWYSVIHQCPVLPEGFQAPLERHKHNVPLSTIVQAMKQCFPQVTVDIEDGSLVAYRLYKAMTE